MLTLPPPFVKWEPMGVRLMQQTHGTIILRVTGGNPAEVSKPGEKCVLPFVCVFVCVLGEGGGGVSLASPRLTASEGTCGARTAQALRCPGQV